MPSRLPRCPPASGLALLAAGLGLALAACTTTPDPQPARPGQGALARVHGETFAEAFERLGAHPYEAVFTSEALGPDGAALSAETLTLRHTPGRGFEQVVEGGGEASRPAPSADAEALVRLRMVNPFRQMLSDEPAYLNPAVREQYALTQPGDTLVGGVRAQLVEAVYTAARGRAQPIQRVRAAVDPASGEPLWAAVWRLTDSAIYAERGHARVGLARAEGVGWVPLRALSETTVDVPLAEPRRLRTSWRVTSVAGRPLADPEAPRLRSGQPALGRTAPPRPPHP